MNNSVQIRNYQISSRHHFLNLDKIVLLIMVVIFISSSRLVAQSGVTKGDRFININMGLAGKPFEGKGLPFMIDYEAGVDDNFTVKGVLGYLSTSFSDYGVILKYSSMYVGVGGTYYLDEVFELKKGMDLYVSLGLGYRTFEWKNENRVLGSVLNAYNYKNDFILSGYLGWRTYFSGRQKAAFMIELGPRAHSMVRCGITLKP